MSTSILNRRLMSDYEKVRDLIASSGGSMELLGTRGNPPNEYTIGYHCKGITRLSGDKPTYGDHHTVSIHLGANYPREKPAVTMVSPIVHPHVFTNSAVCIGDWIINESLDNLLLRLGAIIQYDPTYFNFNSPANRDAAEWTKRNSHLFPLGRCSFRTVNAAGGIQWTNLS